MSSSADALFEATSEELGEAAVKDALAERIATRICDHPPVQGMCLCSMRAGETCSVCSPSSLDKERVKAMVLEELQSS